MRDVWTDERLDEFSRKVDERFDRLEIELRSLRQETNMRLDRMDARLGAMQHSMVRLASVIIAALVGLIATQLGLILTQI